MMGLKQETVVAIIFGTLTVLGSIGFQAWVAASAYSNHSVLGDATMAQVVARLDKIDASVQGIPLYAQRLAQLEDWRRDQLQYNGSVDTRIRAVEDRSQRTADILADIKTASGVKLKGN